MGSMDRGIPMEMLGARSATLMVCVSSEQAPLTLDSRGRTYQPHYRNGSVGVIRRIAASACHHSKWLATRRIPSNGSRAAPAAVDAFGPSQRPVLCLPGVIVFCDDFAADDGGALNFVSRVKLGGRAGYSIDAKTFGVRWRCPTGALSQLG